VIGVLAAALPAKAFDCGSASTDVEKAICSDPDLLAADDEMTRAYAAVRNSSPAVEQKNLANSQRKWIAMRESQCTGGREEVRDCVREMTDERIHLLLVRPLSGPGIAEKLIPFFIQQDAGKARYDIDFSLIRFAESISPAAKAFNREVRKIAMKAPLGPVTDGMPGDVDRFAQTSMEISFASPELISATVTHYSFDGGAHGNGGVSNINVDVRGGALLSADKLFSKAAKAELFRSCRAQILKQKADQSETGKYDPAEDPNYQESTIAEHINDLSRWTFTDAKAVVSFDQYAIGAYVEGPFACEFPMKSLRASVLPNAPLP
jgi:uncharacterized protein YecT (DUF1311 family)